MPHFLKRSRGHSPATRLAWSASPESKKYIKISRWLRNTGVFERAPVAQKAREVRVSARRSTRSLRMRSAPVIALSPIGGRPAWFRHREFCHSSSWLAQMGAANQDQQRAAVRTALIFVQVLSPFLSQL